MKLPKLRSIHLGELPLYPTTPTLNMAALLPLLENCPHLEDIGLYLDGNASFCNPTTFVKAMRKLRSFSFGMSPLAEENTSKVVFFLSRFLTKTFNVDVHFTINSEYRYNRAVEIGLSHGTRILRTGWLEAWKTVAKSLPDMVAARDEERRMIAHLYKELTASKREGIVPFHLILKPIS
ncbi:hypothetical protein M422DRAFT_43180 [Sphaerobolus stellatus SS14]|nr:hypothetical protein M422DRAFT_43180 [Sphaerobolus stellatus SS14]